ncbi:endonuclease/exonuclease/phosphatase family protein [Sinomicrobium sp. M5D2P9]
MLKKIISYLAATFLIVGMYNCDNPKNQEKEKAEETTREVVFDGTLKVLTLNTWHKGTAVEGGFKAIIDIILQSEADVVMLCEIRNHNDVVFSARIVDELKQKGIEFQSFNSDKSPVILSKHPIIATPTINSGALTKCIVELDEETRVAVYAAHLDYTHYACYLPRGYDGITWKKLPEPVLDVHKILSQNKASQRDEAIEVFVNDASAEQQNGNLVLLAGDFNEPSHLDWTNATKDLFDHNGTVVPWQNSITLQENGYLDAYRVKYPDPVTHPGFTWAAFNRDAELSKLVWTPDADDRDRIDFIYYNRDDRLSLTDVIVAGPSGCIVRGQGYEDNTLLDEFLLPEGIWPSDHKGILATFKVN